MGRQSARWLVGFGERAEGGPYLVPWFGRDGGERAEGGPYHGSFSLQKYVVSPSVTGP